MHDHIFYLDADRENALDILYDFISRAKADGKSIRFEIGRTKDDEPNWLKLKMGEFMWSPPIYESYPDPTRVDFSSKTHTIHIHPKDKS